MTHAELAKSLRVGLFASRPTVAEAYKYATGLLQSLPDVDRIAAYTALHVMMNTIADEIEHCKE